MRALLIEDDEDLGEIIRTALAREGNTVDWVKDGQAAISALSTENFDIAILDLGLPKIPGLEVLRTVRNQGNSIPILILTAHEAIEERVKGLDMGADDYMVKPFDLDELSARIRAMRRRDSGRANPIIIYKGIQLDPAAHTVEFEAQSFSLPRREFALLQKLLENPGKALSREQLTQSIYSWDEDVDSNALEVHIHNLRKKFGNDMIRTIRGVGYMIEKDES